MPLCGDDFLIADLALSAERSSVAVCIAYLEASAMHPLAHRSRANVVADTWRMAPMAVWIIGKRFRWTPVEGSLAKNPLRRIVIMCII
jgi:hypothetical protein